MIDHFEQYDKEDRLLNDPNITRSKRLEIYAARAKKEQWEDFDLSFVVLLIAWASLIVYTGYCIVK